MPRTYVSTPAIDRFEAKYIPEPNSGCSLWLAAYNEITGYGYFSDKKTRRHYLAHRFAWEHYRGPIPNGLQVLHKCDVKLCVNPDHLFLGTQADNMADMIAKGRGAHGARNGGAFLTEAQVRAIRADPRRQRVIAEEYGVWQQTVSLIKRGKRWRELV